MKALQSVMDVQSSYQGQSFTALLTGQEFWLVLDRGFFPVSMVMGHCIYAMGSMNHLVNTAKGNMHGEVKEFSEFMHQARSVALARMQFEADQLGADGVVGINMDVKYLHNNEWMQVIATGTAVRYVGTGDDKQPSEQGRVVIQVK
jgi:uncharacterized protein YbjQ (UPF0145 family)